MGSLVCMCVLLKLLNQLSSVHNVWCESYAIGTHPNLTLLDLLRYVPKNIDARTCDVEATLSPLNIGP